MKKSAIPNVITLLNLLCGVIGINLLMSAPINMHTIESSLEIICAASFFVLLGTILDFFDGFFARLFNVQSAFGRDLDSLADLVSYGVLPSLIFSKLLGIAVLVDNLRFNYNLSEYITFIPFIFPCFTAYRLARFNNSPPKLNFEGLSSTATGIIISSITIALYYSKNSYLKVLLLDSWVLIFIVSILSLLMVSNIEFFSLKISLSKLKKNKIFYSLLAILITILIFVFGPISPLILSTVYVVVCVLMHCLEFPTW